MTVTDDRTTRTSAVVPWWAHAAWAVLGAAATFGVLALLTVGVFVLPVTALLVGLGLLLPAMRTRAVLASVAGAAGPLLYVAFLHRHGPGVHCTSSATEVECADLMSPWPFVLLAVLAVAASYGLVRAARASGW
ncbi:hypothetical protein [Aeromicrobium sp. IC_218]|uniref:hypothetical protein n=1 Tax=Aeromicrobium sp. IC_218 TaxID=2545468 RepID=UPI001040B412|nr:hypothetical protein [Aeromicrobium sp. IC_218]TCI96023.1 hypothetical protein E0W78_15405 [Aeromicrobium sp. IC_218]